MRCHFKKFSHYTTYYTDLLHNVIKLKLLDITFNVNSISQISFGRKEKMFLIIGRKYAADKCSSGYNKIRAFQI